MGTDKSHFSWENIKVDLKDAAQYLFQFIKNPFSTIRQIPNWQWGTILLLQFIASAVSGILSGIVAQSTTQILAGLFLFPIVSTVGLGIITGFFYYVFIFFKQCELPFRHLFTLMFLANLPFLAAQVLNPLFSLISMIGLAFSSLLLIVGLVDFFRMEKKFVIRLLGVLFLLCIAFWVLGRIESSRMKKELYQQTTPESLDILQRELEAE